MAGNPSLSLTATARAMVVAFEIHSGMSQVERYLKVSAEIGWEDKGQIGELQKNVVGWPTNETVRSGDNEVLWAAIPFAGAFRTYTQSSDQLFRSGWTAASVGHGLHKSLLLLSMQNHAKCHIAEYWSSITLSGPTPDRQTDRKTIGDDFPTSLAANIMGS